MNQRDRLVAVFEKKPIDHLPWVPDLGYWIEAEAKRGRLPEKYEGRAGRIHICKDVTACAYYGYGAYPAQCIAEGVKQSSQDKDGVRVERWECDGHVLEKHRRWMADSFCYGITKYPVTEVSQLAVVREIFARRQYVPNPNANVPARELGGDGHPITPMPRSPLPALLADWVGVEGTIFMMVDALDEVEKTLEVIERANDGFFPHLPDIESRICHFCDNLSADTIGGYWDTYCADYYRRRVQQVHDAGKYCVTHLDGATKALIPRLVASGLDGIESLTPQPVGDITMEEMSDLMGDADTVLWGGLPGAMFAGPFSWNDLKEMIDGLHRLYRGGRRVVVASADLVPPDGDIELVRRVGRYLIELGN
ncbi:MAG: hypothetical protein GXP25_11355 [Planctomycetes bacterium]|nr:hypothetical protein [Planctomycetota bacterium]